MKCLSCVEPGKFEYIKREIPVIQPGFSLIKIKRIGICGTDLHAFEGTQPYFNYPRILGHELAAIYVSGNAEGFEKGEQVTIIPYFNCGHCIACRSGKPNCCVDIKVCGVHVDGGFSEYLLVPDNSLLHARGLNLDELALVEPLAIGAHGVRRAGVQEGENVLVLGAGPIGMGIMEFARIAGAQVIALDINNDRLQFAKQKLGVSHILNPKEQDVISSLKQITNTEIVSVIIDATGNRQAINGALDYLAHGGRYVLVGLQKDTLVFSHPEFHKRETTLMSSRNATREDFDQVMDAMLKKEISPATYITHRLHFDEVADKFHELINPLNGVIKAMTEL